MLERLSGALDLVIARKDACDKAATNIRLIYDTPLSQELLSQGRVLGLYEDIEVSNLSDKTLLQSARKAYNGRRCRSWLKTAGLSMAGFVRREELAVFTNGEVDLCSRFLLANPTWVNYSSTELVTPVPSDVPSLGNIFLFLCRAHGRAQTYQLTPEAKVLFDRYYDMLQDGLKTFEQQERYYCMMSKASGQLARVAAVLAALRQAISMSASSPESGSTWETDISTSDLELASTILNYSLDCRVTLLNSPRNLAFNIRQGLGKQLEPSQEWTAEMPAMQAVHNNGVEEGAEADEEEGDGAPKAKRPRLLTKLHNDIEAATLNHSARIARNVSRRSVNDDSVNTSSSYYFPCTPGIEEERFTPAKASSTYASCMALSSSDLVGFTTEQQTFIRRFGYKMKTLLEFHGSSRISPSIVAQRHLMPPIALCDVDKNEAATRYPVAAAKEFLGKIADLGFGIIESSSYSGGSRMSFVFKKFTIRELSESASSLLGKLQVQAEEYMAPFDNKGSDQRLASA